MMNLTAAKIKACRQARCPDGRGMGGLQLMLLLLVICFGLSIVPPALAASDTRTAASATGTGWTNLSATVLDSASGSLATSPNNTNKATLSNFGFSITSGAQIDGIQVDVIGQSGGKNKTADYQVEISGDMGIIWKSPNSGGATRQFTDSSPQSHTLGGLSDDWGWSSEGWDDTNFSNTNFRLRIWNLTTGARDPSFEQVQVTVYYTTAPDLS